MTFMELSKNLRKDFSGLKKVKVALLGDSATQFLSMMLRAYGYEQGLCVELFEADYNLIYETLSDGESRIYKEGFEYLIVFQSSEYAMHQFSRMAPEERLHFAEMKIDYMRMLVDTVVSKNPSAKVIVFNFPEIDDSTFGSFSAKTPFSFLNQIRRLNVLIQDLAQDTKNLFVVDVLSLVNRVGRSNSVSPKLYVSTGNVFELNFLPIVAKACLDIVGAFSGRINKCLVLDLDNTIWGGVIGDDGLEKIQIGELGVGRAFTQLQWWVKGLVQRGIIVAICSKNDEAAAKEPFEVHPDMVLRMEDIAVFVANWNNKGDNIKYIQEVLNIGLDSIVFVDDNPFERNLVRSMLPDVVVPELPPDPAEYLGYLQSLNLFETVSVTTEDTQRTRQYREESERVVLRNSYDSFGEYLSGLGMVATVEAITPFNIARCAQLTQRSNQFNLTTIRYSEDQLEQFLSGGGRAVCISLKDKFGDYGLVSLLLLTPMQEGVMEVNTWVMSCRVLKRCVEEFAVNQMVKAAASEGARVIKGKYIQTSKNGMVKDLYSRMGFRQVGDFEYVIEVDAFLPFEVAISEVI